MVKYYNKEKRNTYNILMKPQATSIKPQDLHAANTISFKQQAQPEVASLKPQAPSEESHKPQASSDKQQAS